MNSGKHRRGFILLEVLLGVMIFAIGVLALGKCVNNCLSSEIAGRRDQIARLVLANRMAQIEGGEVKVDKEKSEELTGMFAGMKIRQKTTPLKFKNEKKQPVEGLSNVDLEVSWTEAGEPQSKVLSFYVMQK
jgi:hypothetical protein